MNKFLLLILMGISFSLTGCKEAAQLLDAVSDGETLQTSASVSQLAFDAEVLHINTLVKDLQNKIAAQEAQISDLTTQVNTFNRESQSAENFFKSKWVYDFQGIPKFKVLQDQIHSVYVELDDGSITHYRTGFITSPVTADFKRYPYGGGGFIFFTEENCLGDAYVQGGAPGHSITYGPDRTKRYVIPSNAIGEYSVEVNSYLLEADCFNQASPTTIYEVNPLPPLLDNTPYILDGPIYVSD